METKIQRLAVLTPLKCLFRDMANAELISYKDRQVRQLKLLQDIASDFKVKLLKMPLTTLTSIH